jgi:16S rRNA processing protein RimM
MANRYAVAKIVGCFGVKGVVKLLPTTHSAERFNKLRTVFVGATPDEARQATVEEVSITPKGVSVKLSLFDDRTSAERAVGSFLFVDGKDVVRPSPGTYLVDELVGCTVEKPDGTRLGTVEDVLRTPAQDLWAVRTGTGKLVYLPAVKSFVKEVRMADRVIIVEPIEGLLEE